MISPLSKQSAEDYGCRHAIVHTMGPRTIIRSIQLECGPDRWNQHHTFLRCEKQGISVPNTNRRRRKPSENPSRTRRRCSSTPRNKLSALGETVNHAANPNRRKKRMTQGTPQRRKNTQEIQYRRPSDHQKANQIRWSPRYPCETKVQMERHLQSSGTRWRQVLQGPEDAHTTRKRTPRTMSKRPQKTRPWFFDELIVPSVPV